MNERPIYDPAEAALSPYVPSLGLLKDLFDAAYRQAVQESEEASYDFWDDLGAPIPYPKGMTYEQSCAFIREHYGEMLDRLGDS